MDTTPLGMPPLCPQMPVSALLTWLQTFEPAHLAFLFATADATRQRNVGQEVHLRGLVEIGNYCQRQCLYCGLRSGNLGIERYRLSTPQILQAAHLAAEYGWGTVVLQAGEDAGFSQQSISEIVSLIKQQTSLAVTLSLGERSHTELAAWRQAGADRYLLRFETSDQALFNYIHPHQSSQASRLQILQDLRELGYEVGSGIMVGIPGQSYLSVAHDLDLFRQLRLHMVGLGPFIPSPGTPLAEAQAGGPKLRDGLTQAELAGDSESELAYQQIPNDELAVYKTLALTRILLPKANIPATTALATINKPSGRLLGLQRGANVVMPNLTPSEQRRLYNIYPDKACANETAEQTREGIEAQLASIGRGVSQGPGTSLAYLDSNT